MNDGICGKCLTLFYSEFTAFMEMDDIFATIKSNGSSHTLFYIDLLSLASNPQIVVMGVTSMMVK